MTATVHKEFTKVLGFLNPFRTNESLHYDQLLSVTEVQLDWTKVMDHCCEYLEDCPIFKYLREFVKQAYMDMYCAGDYEKCRRRKLRVAGKPVPENLLPYGGQLWKDGEVPPTVWVR
jgi:hypothetical protein